MTTAEFLAQHYRQIAVETECNAAKCPQHAAKLCAHAALMRQFADDVSAPGIDDSGIVAALVRACEGAQKVGG